MKINNLLGQHGGPAATHLTKKGYEHANRLFDQLCEEQQAAVAMGGFLVAIPLAWVALASAVGLTVDRDGRIVDGPRSDVTERAPITVAHRNQCE